MPSLVNMPMCTVAFTAVSYERLCHKRQLEHVRAYFRTHWSDEALSQEYIRGRGKPGTVRYPRLTSPRSKECLSVCARRNMSVHTVHEEGIPWTCITLIYRQTMARIVAASEACGLVCCAIYTSQGEVAVLRFGLPLPLVYFQL